MVSRMPRRTTSTLTKLGLIGAGTATASGVHGRSKPLRVSATRCGCRSWPVARPAVARASCSGVTFQSPWPMAMLTVSPGYQRSLRVASFAAGDGRMPPISPLRSMPVGAPKP